ncbi:MAG: hypothetical protein AAGC71_08545 [Pseudomonadota bacterium]
MTAQNHTFARQRRQIAIRLTIVALPLLAVGAGIVVIEHGLGTSARNIAPLFIVLLGAAVALWRNNGRWWHPEARWILMTIGFAVPSVGLSLYLHYRWALDIDAVRTSARNVRLLFAWLPAYTLFAGAIGAALGHIVGRQLDSPHA